MDVKKTARVGLSALALIAGGCSALSGGASSTREIKNPELRMQVKIMADKKADSLTDPYALIGVFDWYKAANDVDGMCSVIRKMPFGDSNTLGLVQKLDGYLEAHPEYLAERGKLPELLSSE